MTTFAVGDKGTKLQGTLSDNSAPVDITGTTLALRFLPPGGAPLNRAATIVDGTAGTWEYVWVDGDLTRAGDWRFEISVIAGGTLQQTFGPGTFKVVPIIGG